MNKRIVALIAAAIGVLLLSSACRNKIGEPIPFDWGILFIAENALEENIGSEIKEQLIANERAFMIVQSGGRKDTVSVQSRREICRLSYCHKGKFFAFNCVCHPRDIGQRGTPLTFVWRSSFEYAGKTHPLKIVLTVGTDSGIPRDVKFEGLSLVEETSMSSFLKRYRLRLKE